MRGSLTIIPVICLCACAKDNEGSLSHSFRIHENNGVTIAETTGGPKYEGELFAFEEILTLKEDPDNPESFLNRPHVYFFVDKQGLFYVADRRDSRIAVFGPDGEYLRSFGRGGDGPGEFRDITPTHLYGDVLNLWDSSLQRATLFRTDGTLIDVLTSPKVEMLVGLQRDNEGNTCSFYPIFRDRLKFRYYGKGVRVSNMEGSILCDIRTKLVKSHFRNSRRGYDQMPFVGYPEVTLLESSEILYATGEEPRLELYNRHGTLVRDIRIDLAYEPVPEHAIQATRDALRAVAREGPRGDYNRALAEEMQFPEHMAFWQGVYQDTHGYFWLVLPPRFFTLIAQGGERFRVLSPEGEYLGDTTCPGRNGRIMYGKYLAFRTDEETGVRIPVVYDIRPAVEGLIYP